MESLKGLDKLKPSISSTSSALLNVIAQASKLLVDTPSWTAVIYPILELLQQALQVKSVYLFNHTSVGSKDYNVGDYYSWPPIPSDKKTEQLMSLQRMPLSWINQLRKELIFAGNVSSYPKSVQKILMARKVGALLAVSVAGNDEWYGFMGVEYHDQAYRSTNDDIEGLKSIAIVIAAAIKWQTGRQQRRQHKDRFVLTMEKASCGIVYLDKDGIVTYANEKICQILGYSREEMLAKNMYEYTHPEDIEIYQNFVKEVFESDNGRSSIEKRSVRKDGKVIWVQITCLLAVNQDVGERSYIAIIDEITAKQDTQEMLRESEQRFQIVSMATNDAIWDWNYKTDTIWWNSGIETLFGYIKNEVDPAYSWWEEHVHPNDLKRVLQELDALVTKRHNYWTAEYRFQYGNGSYATVFDRAYIMYDDSGRAVRMIGSIQDISRQKKAEASLQNSREQLRNLAKQVTKVREDERKRLSRELHDEFAQILTALKMDLQWLGRKLPAELELLQERTNAMVEIVNSTMDRVRQIATELRPVLLDDLGICAAIDWQLKEFYARTGCVCLADICIDESKLDGDLKITLFRIFQEALSNIARHTRATRVSVSLKEEDDIIVLEINDNGDGISSKKLNDVNSIGLIGMRERAGAYGGAVKIESLPEQGTSVNVKIPLLVETS